MVVSEYKGIIRVFPSIYIMSVIITVCFYNLPNNEIHRSMRPYHYNIPICDTGFMKAPG